MNIIKRWLADEPVRVYVYGLVGPVIALLVALNLISGSLAAALGSIAAAGILAPAVEALRKRTVPETRTPQVDRDGTTWYPVAGRKHSWSTGMIADTTIVWPGEDPDAS